MNKKAKPFPPKKTFRRQPAEYWEEIILTSFLVLALLGLIYWVMLAVKLI